MVLRGLGCWWRLSLFLGMSSGNRRTFIYLLFSQIIQERVVWVCARNRRHSAIKNVILISLSDFERIQLSQSAIHLKDGYECEYAYQEEPTTRNNQKNINKLLV